MTDIVESTEEFLIRRLKKSNERIKQLESALLEADKGLAWYCDNTINNHRYHADMDNDLRVKAQHVREKIKPILKDIENE